MFLFSLFSPHDLMEVKSLLQIHTCFHLYKVITREVYTKAYNYSKFCQRCALAELKYNIVNQNQ